MENFIFDTFGNKLKEGDMVDYYMILPSGNIVSNCRIGFGAYTHEPTKNEKWGWFLSDRWGNEFSLEDCLKFGQIQKVY